MTRDTYAALAGVNWSSLRHIADSPMHYRHRLDHPPAQTSAMVLGIAAHMAILEPERFESEVVTPPPDALASNGARRGKAWEAWRDAHADRVILTASEHAQCVAMAESVRAHPSAARLLDGVRAEVPLTWRDEATGLACKGLVDALRPDGVLVDVKTTSKGVGPRAFSAHVARMGYHAQLAHYRAGVLAEHGACPAVYIVAVESVAPYDVVVYEVDEDALYAGDEWRRELLARLAECMERDEWPGTSSGVERLELPAWAATSRDVDDGWAV